MSDQQPPPENPYGQPTQPENPYGQPTPAENPYGQPADTQGQPVASPNPYGQSAGSQDVYSGQPPTHSAPVPAGYGYPAPRSGARPGTVTAAGWITIALSGLSALLYAFGALMLLVARGPIVDEIEKQPEFRELDVDIDADSIIAVFVAIMLVLVVWSLVSLVLGIFVLRRSNVARILLVISSAVVALASLLAITSGVSVVWLAGAVAVIVLLFTGGAGDWFARRSTINFRGMGGVEDPPGQGSGAL